MKVKELIEFLKTIDHNLDVAYKIFSEQCLLELDDIEIKELCEARSDGWIHDFRKDKPSRKYLVLAGN